MPRWIWRRPVWLVPATIVLVAGLGVLVWRFGPRSDPGFIEYRMLVKTDIPTALAVAPNGAVWFTIEFSDAIAVFRNGKIERFPKGTQNLEPLGLAVDAAGGAWYTDTPRMVRSGLPMSPPRASRNSSTVSSRAMTSARWGRLPTGLPSTLAARYGRRCRARTSWRASRAMAK